MEGEDCVDRAPGLTDSQILVDNVVVNMRNKMPNGDGHVSLEPPLRDSVPQKDLGSPSKFRPTSSCSKKNTRRRMEDRHVVLHDLKAYLPSTLQSKVEPDQHVSFYAVYDGHAGISAATVAAAHLHEKLVESSNFNSDPLQAFVDAIKSTDKMICDDTKSKKSGSTLVSNLIKNNVLYSAWLGDAQTVLARAGQAISLVDPHSPKRLDEQMRIQSLGGTVNFFGVWRVNASLSVSRALGDDPFKPVVSNDCDITTVQLGGIDDFLIVACDGLWDGLTPDEAVQIVYDFVGIEENHANLEELSVILTKAAIDKGSTDNITTIVVFFKNLQDIRTEIVSGRGADINVMEGITSTSDIVLDPTIERQFVDPGQQTPFGGLGNTPKIENQARMSPAGFNQSGGGQMFSPDPFSSLAQLQGGAGNSPEMFGQFSLDNLRPSLTPNNSIDDIDFGSGGTESPQRVDSGFISPKKEEDGIPAMLAEKKMDDLLKILNKEDQEDEEEEEERSLEEILAARRDQEEGGFVQVDDDDDDDDDDELEDDVVAVVDVDDDDDDDDDSDDGDEFAKVHPTNPTNDKNFSKEEQQAMDPCQQVVVKETHPEESGCLVPPVSQLPTSQDAVVEHLTDNAGESVESVQLDGQPKDNGMEVQVNGVGTAVSVVLEEEEEEEVKGFMLKTAGQGDQVLGAFTPQVQIVEDEPVTPVKNESPVPKVFVLPATPGLGIPTLNIIPSTPTRSRSPVQGESVAEGVDTSDDTNDTNDVDTNTKAEGDDVPVKQISESLEGVSITSDTAEPDTPQTEIAATNEPEKKIDPVTEPNNADTEPKIDSTEPISIDTEQKVDDTEPKMVTSQTKADETKQKPVPAARKAVETKPKTTVSKSKTPATKTTKSVEPKVGGARTTTSRTTSSASTRPTPAASKPTTAATRPTPGATKPTPAATRPTQATTRPTPAASRPTPRPASSTTSRPTSSTLNRKPVGETKTKPATDPSKPATDPSKPAAAARAVDGKAAGRPGVGAATAPRPATNRPAVSATRTKPAPAPSNKPEEKGRRGPIAPTPSSRPGPSTTSRPAAARPIPARTAPKPSTVTAKPSTAAAKPSSTAAAKPSSVAAKSSSVAAKSTTAAKVGSPGPAAAKSAFSRSGFSKPGAPSAAASRVAAARAAALKKPIGGTLPRKKKSDTAVPQQTGAAAVAENKQMTNNDTKEKQDTSKDAADVPSKGPEEASVEVATNGTEVAEEIPAVEEPATEASAEQSNHVVG